MLQQTTVTAVVPYLERFLSALPTVDDLAAADEAAVLKLWEGLGYYSRARNLRRAAVAVVDEFGGSFPETARELEALPGIGPYTAGAIASFAFGQSAPIVEANTQRLYARLLAFDEDLSRSASQKQLWAFAEALVPKADPGDFNQALMDLGATVCTPAEPRCPECPIKSLCRAFERGAVDSIPRPKARAAVTDVVEVYLLVERNELVLVRQRREGELWEGLWDFPRFPADELTQQLPAQRSWVEQPALPGLFRGVEETAATSLGSEVRVRGRLGDVRHAVTRYRMRVLTLRAEPVGKRRFNGSNYQWIDVGKLAELAMTKPARRVAEHVYQTVSDPAGTK